MYKSSITTLTELQKNVDKMSPLNKKIERINAASQIYTGNTAINLVGQTPALRVGGIVEALRLQNEVLHSLSSFKQQQEILTASFRAISPQIVSMSEQISAISKALQSSGLTDAILKIQENKKLFQAINPSILQLQSTLHEVFSRPEFQNIIINYDGSIATDTDFFPKEEVEESVIQAAQDLDRNNISEKLTKEISKGNTLQIIAFIITLFLAIPNLIPTIQFYNNAIDYALNHVKDRTQLIRSIQRNPTSYYEGINLNSPAIISCKFTISAELSIRTNPSTKSQKLGILAFGDAVIVLRKKRNWTLVKPLDPNKEHMQGWTFTRYLKDIVPKNKNNRAIKRPR